MSKHQFKNTNNKFKKSAIDNLHVGQVIQGTVKNITKYGAFVDIGGVDGLLHITDMAWTRISNPGDILKTGDSVSVKVLALDKINERISLGMKQLSSNPWEAMDAQIKAGARVSGTVTNITDYGLFVEVDKGVEGLVHISEISWTDRISDLNKYYKINDTLEVYVVSIDKVNRRMSLSVKQLKS